MVALRGIRAVYVALAALVLVCAVLSVRVFAQEPGPRSAVSNAFTFQGRAVVDGLPIDDTCDLRFSVFDAAEGGTQTGPTIEKAAVEVANGLFSTQLDFGAGVFAGDARFIAIELRCPAGTGTYAALPGRQELTATPYALYSQQVPYSGIVGGPPGFGEGWENVIVVAKSGGQFTTIQGAIDSITGASNENRFLVWVAPAIYEERITIPSYVTVRGAGKDLTTIKATGGATLEDSIAVNMAAFASLDSVRVELSGEGPGNHVIHLVGQSMHTSEAFIRDTAVYSSAKGDSIGIYALATTVNITGLDMRIDRGFGETGGAVGLSLDAAMLLMNTFDVWVAGSPETYGIYANNSSWVEIAEGSILSSSGDFSYGLVQLGGNPSNLREVTFDTSGSNGSTAIIVSAFTSLVITESFIQASSPLGNVTGIFISGGGGMIASDLGMVFSHGSSAVSNGIYFSASNNDIRLQNVRIGVPGVQPTRSVYTNVSGAANIYISESTLYGAPAIVAQNTSQVFRIANTLVDGKSGGTFICTAAYNASYAPLGATC